MSNSTLVAQLAEALCDMTVERIPEHVLHQAKRALLDALGAGLAGATTTEVNAVVQATLDWQARGPITVWARSERLSAPHAALVNGTAVHAREVDDFGGCGHSGAVVIPAVLAAAELARPRPAELLGAIVAGYEAAARITELVGGYNAHNAAGWHGTGTCGVFGAAAGAARILGLTSAQTAHALALAGTYTGGVWSFIVDGAMSKRLHAGKAAETGLAAAFLARAGLTGPGHILESDWGSFASLYGGSLVNTDGFLRGLGQEYLIFRSGFKPYACCRGCHSSLDAVLQLRTENRLQAEQIQRVMIYASEQNARQLGKHKVDNILDAQMSLPYSVAVALRTGRADLEYYQPPHLDDPVLNALARQVYVVADADHPLGSQATVEIQLRDGKVLRASVEHAKGETLNPLTDAELEAKYLVLATLTVPRDRAERTRDAVWTLDRLSTIDDLIRELALDRGELRQN